MAKDVTGSALASTLQLYEVSCNLFPTKDSETLFHELRDSINYD